MIRLPLVACFASLLAAQEQFPPGVVVGASPFGVLPGTPGTLTPAANATHSALATALLAATADRTPRGILAAASRLAGDGSVSAAAVAPASTLPEPFAGFAAKQQWAEAFGALNTITDPNENLRVLNLLMVASGQPPIPGLPGGAPAAATTPPESQAFADQLTTGRWADALAQVAKLPDAIERDLVIDKLLADLGDGASLLPDDLLDLTAALPAPLSDARCDSVAKALAGAVKRTPGTAALVARLEQGLGGGGDGIGGADPRARRRAARLLAGIDDGKPAAGFLPPLERCEADHDLDAQELHLRLLADRHDDPTATQAAFALAGRMLDRLPKPAPAAPAAPAQPTTPGMPPGMAFYPGMPQPAATPVVATDPWTRTFRRWLDLGQRRGDAATAAWMRELFIDQPARGREVLASVIAPLTPASSAGAPADRQRGLGDARTLLRGCLGAVGSTTAAGTEAWRTAARVVADAWAAEARLALEVPVLATEGLDNLPWEVSWMQKRQNEMNSRQGQPWPITFPQLARIAPDEPWLAWLPAAQASGMRRQIAQIRHRADTIEDPDWIVALVQADPQIRQEAVDQLLGDWFAVRDERESRDKEIREVQNRYRGGYTQSQAPASLPLSRSRQQRQLANLAQVLTALQAAGVVVTPEHRARLFADAVSPAELFRETDLAIVVGGIATLDPAIAGALASTMRTRLQQADSTGPATPGQPMMPGAPAPTAPAATPNAQQRAELARGQRLALALAERAATSGRWQDLTVQAGLLMDAAARDQAAKAPLETVTGLRRQAFASYAKALPSALAEPAKPAGPPAAPRAMPWMPQPVAPAVASGPDPLLDWFNAALGASSEIKLDRGQEADGVELDRLAAVLRQGSATANLERFAEVIRSRLSAVPAHQKSRWLLLAMRVLGEHPGADDLRRKARRYQDLLSELAVVLRCDGGTTVGDRPFGVHLLLRASTTVARESTGFDRLLRNQVMQANGAQVNLRDQAEARLRETFNERFTISSITWHIPEVQLREVSGSEAGAWQEKPLAYLLLSVKDPATDRLPSVLLDLDFTDAGEPLVLPIASAPVLIDARPGAPVTPPAIAELATAMTLDARGVGTGQPAVLDVLVSGSGLLGELEALGYRDPAGWHRAGSEGGELTISGVESTEQRLAAKSERRIRLTYQPDPGVDAFTFPAIPGSVTAVRKQILPQDIAEVGATVALRAGGGATAWWLRIAGVVVVAVGIALAVVWRRRRRPATAVAERMLVPDRLDPVTAHALLRRLHGHPALDPVARAGVTDALAQLDRRSFARGATPLSTAELLALVAPWVEAINRRAAEPGRN